MPHYYVCSYLLNHTSVNVGQEDRPRRYCSQGYQHQWCHINTWLPTGRYHCCCSHHSFFFCHTQTYIQTNMHTHTRTQRHVLYMVCLMLMSFWKHSAQHTCQDWGDESPGSWYKTLTLVHRQEGLTLELHAGWCILIFIFFALQQRTQMVAVYSPDTLTHGELCLTRESSYGQFY